MVLGKITHSLVRMADPGREFLSALPHKTG